MPNRAIKWCGLFLAVVSPVITIGSLIMGEWWTAAIFASLSVYGVREVRNERRRGQVTAAWPPERVESVVGGIDDPVKAARKLREADPQLGLSSSLDLATNRRSRGLTRLPRPPRREPAPCRVHVPRR